jgi:RsiW-degrading membrane proteinase PrsW (M82 family)
MSYLLYIFFALLPSLAWLCFYLRKDAHPESNRMIVKIFLYGMLIALPAALIELGFYEFSSKLKLSQTIIFCLNIFIGVALVEEFLKYLIIKEKIIHDSEFDEPLDAMLYMMITALGFAALENILILFHLGQIFLIGKVLTISIFRFLGATFLHALCSGLIGYFLALSFFETKRKFYLIISGLAIATILHGLYNLSIINPSLIYQPLGITMTLGESLKFILPVIILISLALFVSLGFKKLRKLKSVCKIK